MRLAGVLRWLKGGGGVAERCPAPVPQLSWVPPKPRQVSAVVQARAFVKSLQDSEDWGIQPRGYLLRRYPELCEMEGFVPVKHNALCEALTEVLGGEKKAKCRPMVDGHRITAYIIPEPIPPKTPRGLHVIPSGNAEGVPWPDLPQRSRAGTSYAQA